MKRARQARARWWPSVVGATVSAALVATAWMAFRRAEPVSATALRETGEVVVLNYSQNRRLALGQAIEARQKLRKLGTNALPALLNMLNARDSMFTELLSTVERLGIKQNNRVTTALKLQQEAVTGFEVLGPIAAPAIPQLVKMVGKGDRALLAVAALGRIGEEALPALAGALRHENSSVRLQALASMVLIMPQGSAFLDDCFASSFGDTDPVVRGGALAIFPLNNVPSTNVTAHIEKLLEDPDPAVRTTATQVVASIQQIIKTKPRYR